MALTIKGKLSEMQADLASFDTDLVTGNIKNGANILGVSGKASVVETSDANAVAGDIALGKTAYVNGVKITGTAE